MTVGEAVSRAASWQGSCCSADAAPRRARRPGSGSRGVSTGTRAGTPGDTSIPAATAVGGCQSASPTARKRTTGAAAGTPQRTTTSNPTATIAIRPPATATAPRPLGVRFSVSPWPESTVCASPEIRVSLTIYDDSTARAIVALLLDGADVTPRDYPIYTTYPAQATLAYRPPQPLVPGHHTATLAYPADAGARQTYTWAFEVGALPCPLPTPPPCATPTQSHPGVATGAPSGTPAAEPDADTVTERAPRVSASA